MIAAARALPAAGPCCRPGAGRARIVREKTIANKEISDVSQRAVEPAEEALAVAAEKRRARTAARARRDALPPDERAAASKAITARCLADPLVAASHSVFAFLSAAQEVHTHDIIEALLARGATVLVPLVIDRETMSAVPFPGWSQLTPGRLGILSPPPTPAWRGRVDLVLVPGLAFTADGARLGYGGGYYDRWLAAAQPRHTAALAFECQVCATLPSAPHDQPLERIFTERRTIECGRATDSS